MKDDAGNKDVKVKKGDETILKLLRKRFEASVIHEKDEREKGQSDVDFINGDQWDKDVMEQRGKGRLCLTINKLPTFLDQIDGDIRLNTPALKVKAVDDDADVDTADVIEGLIRYTQRNSSSNRVHSWAGLHAAAGGRGAWRIITQFVSDHSWAQEILVKRIIDAFSVYADPAAEQDDKQDGNYFIIIEKMTTEEYKEEHGQEQPYDFETSEAGFENWTEGDNHVIVAEYFYKKKDKKTKIYEGDDGSVFTSEDAEKLGYDDEYLKELNSRDIETFTIQWIKADGKRILDRGEIPGQMFPVVLTWGKQLCVKGKIESRGIARHAKDSVRMYNYARSNEAETISMQPKQPYLIPDVCLTPKQQKIWDKANEENYPYLPYHVDPEFPSAKPHREHPPQASSGNIRQMEIADAEMRDTVGIQKAALGQESNETSGVAIQKRKQESDTGQYAYIDNLGEAIKTEGKIILGMIQVLHTVETQMKILGKDMEEKVITVNEEDGINLSVGKYDIDMGIEGSYSTQREEFQDKLTSILPQLPDEYRAIIADILFEMQDFHRASDVAERLKHAINLQYPGIIQDTDDQLDEEGDGVGQIDPETGLPFPVDPGAVDPNAQPPVDPAQVAAQQAETDQAAIATREAEAQASTAEVKLEQEEVKLEGMKEDNRQKRMLTKQDALALLEQVLDELPIEHKQAALRKLNLMKEQTSVI